MDALYHPLIYAFLVGALVPIPVYHMAKRSRAGKDSIWNFVNAPVILSSMTWVPPAGEITFVRDMPLLTFKVDLISALGHLSDFYRTLC